MMIGYRTPPCQRHGKESSLIRWGWTAPHPTARGPRRIASLNTAVSDWDGDLAELSDILDDLSGYDRSRSDTKDEQELSDLHADLTLAMESLDSEARAICEELSTEIKTQCCDDLELSPTQLRTRVRQSGDHVVFVNQR
jgi:hypothetical protein